VSARREGEGLALCTRRDVVRMGATLVVAVLGAAFATLAAATPPAQPGALPARQPATTMPTTPMPTPTPPTRAAPAVVIVLSDRTALRAAPRDSAAQQAVLWQGEVLEVRGERLDYLQVWDHARERGGFVRASQVHRSSLAAAEAPALLALVRFTSGGVGTEALGLGLAAAWLGAAPADNVHGPAGIEALDALGSFADRLAQRASAGVPSSRVAQAALAAHLEVAGRHGVRFASFERDGRMQICYDGEAFRRVLAFGGQPLQQARAALALTRPECVDPARSAAERAALDEWRASVLDRVDATRLPAYLRNRIAMRRAGLWSAIAFRQARHAHAGEASAEAAERALAELASVDKAELTDADLTAYREAAMRVNASRWAARSAVAPRMGAAGLAIATAPGEPGQTCVLLVDSRHPGAAPLARRCTDGIAWTASATRNREGNALTLAVQPLEAWRELWVFRKGAGAGASPSCRRRTPRPASATPSSPAGCPAGSRCWSPARRRATAGSVAASSGSASTAWHRAPVGRSGLARRLPALTGAGLEARPVSLR
jgi:hypothetical protein